MKIRIHKHFPLITVIVNFYNNKREAVRTLYSLTSKYQDVSQQLYNVIVLDNNSSESLDNAFVKKFGSNFRYLYFKNEFPSPCRAINYGVQIAKSPFVVICIDGARILSPGILKYMLKGISLESNPFIYTLGMHIGSKPQNYLIEEGYNQDIEDDLLNKVNWQDDGYKLFDISCMALSSKNGFFSPINESNCFLIRKDDFLNIGGYDERFVSKGGGLVNLDFFNQIQESKKIQNIMLLGEATFHQFHGGIATNVRMNEHPWNEMIKEYKLIRGKDYVSIYKTPDYYGKFR